MTTPLGLSALAVIAIGAAITAGLPFVIVGMGYYQSVPATVGLSFVMAVGAMALLIGLGIWLRAFADRRRKLSRLRGLGHEDKPRLVRRKTSAQAKKRS